MPIIDQDLYQFSTFIPQINLSFNQYLLAADEPLLVHTGNVQQAAALLPDLEGAIDGKGLSYIFVSHFEADECGGLSHVLAEFPEVKTVCSEVTARQLTGFGLTGNLLVKKPGEKLTTKDYDLEFLSYPSEMHLWEGLLAFENQRAIFFSSDLMMSFGEAAGPVGRSSWEAEIKKIRPEQVPDPELRERLKQTLARLSPRFVATGHGPCLRLE